MKKLLQDSFKILRNNLLFIQPLLLYLLMIMLASTYFVSGHVALYPKMLLAVSMILLTVAFFAGWMYINKKGIEPDYIVNFKHSDFITNNDPQLSFAKNYLEKKIQ